MIDLTRKIFLTSMVLFIDQENGSVKLQRLVVAAIVSAMFATMGLLTSQAISCGPLFSRCSGCRPVKISCKNLFPTFEYTPKTPPNRPG